MTKIPLYLGSHNFTHIYACPSRCPDIRQKQPSTLIKIEYDPSLDRSYSLISNARSHIIFVKGEGCFWGSPGLHYTPCISSLSYPGPSGTPLTKQMSSFILFLWLKTKRHISQIYAVFWKFIGLNDYVILIGSHQQTIMSGASFFELFSRTRT